MLKSTKVNSEVHKIFTGDINKIALSGNDDKGKQSIDCKKSNAYGTSEGKTHTK